MEAATQAGKQEGRYCRGCGYDLRGLAGEVQRCPECGWGFDPGEAGTFDRRPRARNRVWRRWLRRAVELAVIVVLLAGGTWGWLYWGWRSEQAAVAKLDARRYDLGPMGGPTLQWYLGGGGWVLDRVTLLDLGGKRVGDGELAGVRDMRFLRELDLSGTAVTDAGMEQLERLYVLEKLGLEGTHVGDAGLAHIGKLRELRSLNLRATRITDAGLMQLRDLKALTVLDLRDTQTGYTGVGPLQTQLPRTNMVHNWGEHRQK